MEERNGLYYIKNATLLPPTLPTTKTMRTMQPIEEEHEPRYPKARLNPTYKLKQFSTNGKKTQIGHPVQTPQERHTFATMQSLWLHTTRQHHHQRRHQESSHLRHRHGRCQVRQPQPPTRPRYPETRWKWRQLQMKTQKDRGNPKKNTFSTTRYLWNRRTLNHRHSHTYLRQPIPSLHSQRPPSRPTPRHHLRHLPRKHHTTHDSTR